MLTSRRSAAAAGLVALLCGLHGGAIAATVAKVHFSASAYTVAETAGHITIAVLRDAPLDRTVTVRYATRNGTARAGEDYVAVSGTLTFGPGEPRQTFRVRILDDDRSEGAETVTLVLSAPSAGALLGTPATAVLTIEANDVPRVQFSTGAFSVGTGARSRTIGVTRTEGFGTTVNVRYATADGTARAGVDYTPVSGVLTFGPGDSVRTFQVVLRPDAHREGDATIRLLLSDPGGGATLGTPPAATLTIVID